MRFIMPSVWMYRMRVVCVAVLLALCVPSYQAKCYGTLSKDTFQRCRLLSSNYALHWYLSNDTVTFGIEIDQTAGWFALGLSEGGGMKGADIWVFSKSSDGAWTAKDMFSTAYSKPQEDKYQDITISSVSQVTGGTVLVFTRKLDTCDVEKDQVIYPKFKQAFIYAFGDSNLGYHGTTNRGTWFFELDPVTEVATTNLGSASVKDLEVLMPNITVPKDETSYLCMNFKAPSDAKYHIISTNYNITPHKMVHHMILYSCNRKPDIPLGQTYPCFATPAECSYSYLFWVPGAESEAMPPNTGFPMGKGSVEYLTLQIHFNNPEGLEGTKDASGFIIQYTPKLREHDLGMMWLGSEGFVIPAGMEKFALKPSVCPSECTSKLAGDLTLVNSEFHMHQLGVRQTVQHLRDVKGEMQEIVPLNYRDHYDFDWQAGTFILPGSETLKPGDALITTCTYSTTGVSKDVSFGTGSRDEMCYNFLRYYPAVPVDRCMSVGEPDNGTQLALCTNLSEFYNYIDKQGYEDFENATVIFDLMDKGFLVPYNTSKYETFKPYERLTPTCAADLAARPSPSPPTSSPAAVVNKSPPPAQPKSGAAPVGAAVWQLVVVVLAVMGVVVHRP